MNIEHAEAQVVDRAVQDWCRLWRADAASVRKEFSVNDAGQLELTLNADLPVPITNVKTKIVIVNAEAPPGELPDGA